MNNPDATPVSNYDERFVARVIEVCRQDKGQAARLRRADNPATEYQSWDFLASMGVNLEYEKKRLPYATIASAIARSGVEGNGTQTLGEAIAACYPDQSDNSPAKARIRRLLACDDMEDLCRTLRPLFSLIDSKTSQPLNFVKLLKQIKSYAYGAQRIKTQWAQEFYGKQAEDNSQ